MASPLKRLLKLPFSLAGYDVRKKDADPVAALCARFGFNTVLDVGADQGLFTAEVRTLLPQATIHSFEPLQASYERLVGRMGPDPAFHAYRTAVGDHDGEIEFHQDEFSAASSVLAYTDAHKNAYPQIGTVRKIRVPLVSLDAWAGDRPLQRPLLIKMDTQGYENRVLRGAGDLLSQADAVITEVCFVKLYEDQALFCDLDLLLRERSFDLLGIVEEGRDPRTGLSLYADAYYTRRS